MGCSSSQTIEYIKPHQESKEINKIVSKSKESNNNSIINQEKIKEDKIKKYNEFISKVEERYNSRGLGIIPKESNNDSNPIKNEEIMENRYLSRKIKKSDLNEFEIELIETLKNEKISYICQWCHKIPLLQFRKESQYSWNNFYAIVSKHDNCSKKLFFSRGHVDPADLIINEKKYSTKIF